ncbi:hypothetical protein PITC_004670 [Penicillium italicum]|uniref:Uncharacterized protein n=1 Tax=Penicillium italicum TaxID=40296 RepID=A0A0A2LCH8_PENIT|nr:hypothetical protein PITC_004670 [Penicillium italicum]
MQSILTSLVYFLCFFTAMVEGLIRYHTTPPSDAIIVHDRQSLNDLVKVNPDTVLYAENGGYYLKNMDEEVVAIAADDLCPELDAAFASIDANFVGDDSESEYLASGSVDGADLLQKLLTEEVRFGNMWVQVEIALERTERAERADTV